MLKEEVSNQNQITINSNNVLVENLPKAKSHKNKNCCRKFSELIRLLFDNSLNFMNIDEKKVNQIKGQKNKWYGSAENIIVGPIFLILLILILNK